MSAADRRVRWYDNGRGPLIVIEISSDPVVTTVDRARQLRDDLTAVLAEISGGAPPDDARALIVAGRKYATVFDDPALTAGFERATTWARTNLAALLDGYAEALDRLEVVTTERVADRQRIDGLETALREACNTLSVYGTDIVAVEQLRKVLG